jgi:integrase
MGRPRKKDKHLPSYVIFKHGAFYYIRNKPWVHLGSYLPDALAKYAREYGAAPKHGVSGPIDTALNTLRQNVSQGTWQQYLMAARMLKKAFANFSTLEQIKPRNIAEMKLKKAHMPQTANLLLTVARQIFQYYVDMQLLDSNPCVGIKPLKTRKRTRLLSREEYGRIYERADSQLRCLMDLLYFTGQRVMDVLKVRYADFGPSGISFHQQKTGARLVVRWTPELRDVVDGTRLGTRHIKATTLFHNRRGKVPSYDVINQAWLKACREAGVEDAQMRDIRAMAATEVYKRDGIKAAQAFLGHTTEQMTLRYLRDMQVPVVDGPSFERKAV